MIAFTLERPSVVGLRIVDVSGRLVRTIVRGALRGAGAHRLDWNGCDDAGRRAAPGVYFVRLDAGGAGTARPVTIVR